MPSDPAPPLAGVLETVLYFDDQDRTEAFYSETMGFRLLHREEGRSLFYRAGGSVFLLFDPRRTQEAGKLPPHGAEGPVHTCFRVPPEAYQAWKDRLERWGVAILTETDWPDGQSFYFEDPAGNLLEIVNADIWPR